MLKADTANPTDAPVPEAPEQANPVEVDPGLLPSDMHAEPPTAPPARGVLPEHDASPHAPNGVDALLAEAYDARNSGDLARAVDAALQAVTAAPDDPRPHSLLANLYESAGRYREAIEEYQSAVDLDPSNRVDLYRIRLLQERLARSPQPDPAAQPHPRDETTRAVRRFRVSPVAVAACVFVIAIAAGAVLLTRPSQPSDLGVSTAGLMTPARAASTAETALSAGQTQRGRDIFDTGDYPRAAGLFRLALAADPANQEARYWLDQCVDRMGSGDQSTKTAEKTDDGTASTGTQTGQGLPAPADTGQAGAVATATAGTEGAGGVPPAMGATPTAAGGGLAGSGLPGTTGADPRGMVLADGGSVQSPQFQWSAAGTATRWPSGAAQTPPAGGGGSQAPKAQIVGETGLDTPSVPMSTNPAVRGSLRDIIGGGAGRVAPSDSGSAKKPVINVTRVGAKGPGAKGASGSASSADEHQRRGLELSRTSPQQAADELQRAKELYLKEGGERGRAGAQACDAVLRTLRQR
ncbi:MAG TPA: tetratricopeptide repeat protein [Armatimonadota bacterium]|nr:tetratricopeptide repeat protein [Armatimonadota bacterium]